MNLLRSCLSLFASSVPALAALSSLGAGLGISTEAHAAEQLCVDRTDRRCYDTIQAAVDAAEPGDTVDIRPAPDYRGHTEAVIITTPNLTIRGNGGTAQQIIIDGCELDPEVADCGLENGFTVSAENVTIKNLTIRHTRRAILLNAPARGARVENVHFVHNDDAVRSLEPVNEVVVTDSSFSHGITYNAVQLVGDHNEVRNNTLRSTEGIRLDGDHAVVVGNYARVTSDMHCIRVRGDRALIEENDCIATDGGIDYEGDYGVVNYNRVRDIHHDMDGIDLLGDHMMVVGNVVENISEEGIDYNGDNSTIRDNYVSRAGNENYSEPGLEVGGNNNLVEANTLINNAYAGIRHPEGNGSIYRSNIVDGNATAGIRIHRGANITVQSNVVTNNYGEGINIDEKVVSASVQFNNVWYNRRDLCNDGGSVDFFANSYGTGGPTVACVVE